MKRYTIEDIKKSETVIEGSPAQLTAIAKVLNPGLGENAYDFQHATEICYYPNGSEFGCPIEWSSMGYFGIQDSSRLRVHFSQIDFSKPFPKDKWCALELIQHIKEEEKKEAEAVTNVYIGIDDFNHVSPSTSILESEFVIENCTPGQRLTIKEFADKLGFPCEEMMHYPNLYWLCDSRQFVSGDAPLYNKKPFSAVVAFLESLDTLSKREEKKEFKDRDILVYEGPDYWREAANVILGLPVENKIFQCIHHLESEFIGVNESGNLNNKKKFFRHATPSEIEEFKKEQEPKAGEWIHRTWRDGQIDIFKIKSISERDYDIDEMYRDGKIHWDVVTTFKKQTKAIDRKATPSEVEKVRKDNAIRLPEIVHQGETYQGQDLGDFYKWGCTQIKVSTINELIDLEVQSITLGSLTIGVEKIMKIAEYYIHKQKVINSKEKK